MPCDSPLRAAGCLLLVCLAAATGCSPPPAARPEPPPPPALVTTAVKKSVPVQVRANGSVKVISTVNVRPRVGGELLAVHFKEGDVVTEKSKLFTIDSRPYEAAVLQARANLKKSEVALKGAEIEFGRTKRGGVGGVVADAAVDAAETAVAAAEAMIAADKAAVNSAELQRSFTTIPAPITGRTGSLLVTKGNLVAANDVVPLVVINQISPIHVAFALPEQQLPTVLAAHTKSPLRVDADLRGGGAVATGELHFIDNSVDSETGTVLLKAEFKNEDQKLWPGLFVDVVLTLGERPDSVVVPSAALQSGQKGQYVYVVNADKRAELRQVAVAFELNGEAVIESGLAGGESVVTEGQLRLAPGARVDATPAPASRPAAAAPGGKK